MAILARGPEGSSDTISALVRRLRRSLAILLLAPLGLLACADGGSRPAAVVNGVEISAAALADELAAIEGNAGYRSAIEARQPVLGQLPKSFDGGFTAAVLTNQISYLLVHHELAERKVKVSDTCRQAAQRDLELSLGQNNPDAGRQVLGAFPGSYADTMVQRNSDVLALQAALSDRGCFDDEVAQAFLDANAAEFRQACVAHILVATDAEANALLTQLQAGADFATLARENSTDTGTAPNGGELGCEAPSRFVTEFANAVAASQPGVVGPPVQTQFGWHLVKVSEFKTPPLAEVREQIEQFLSQEAVGVFQQWFGPALEAAKVTVDGRFGKWDKERGEVVKDVPADMMTSSTSTSTTLPFDAGAGFDPGSGNG